MKLCLDKISVYCKSCFICKDHWCPDARQSLHPADLSVFIFGTAGKTRILLLTSTPPLSLGYDKSKLSPYIYLGFCITVHLTVTSKTTEKLQIKTDITPLFLYCPITSEIYLRKAIQKILKKFCMAVKDLHAYLVYGSFWISWQCR